MTCATAAANAPSSWTEVDDAWTSGNLEYTINPTTPLSNGVTYGVQVRAVVGTTEHPWSETRVGTPRTVPGAPTIRTVDSDEGKTVPWNGPLHPTTAVRTSPPTDVRYIKTDEDEDRGCQLDFEKSGFGMAWRVI